MAYVGIYFFWFVLLIVKHCQLAGYVDSGWVERREIEIWKVCKTQKHSDYRSQPNNLIAFMVLKYLPQDIYQLQRKIVTSQWRNGADTTLTNCSRLISSPVIRHIDIIYPLYDGYSVSLVIFWPKLYKLSLIMNTSDKLKLRDIQQDNWPVLFESITSSKTRKDWGTLTDWQMLRNRKPKYMVGSWIGSWNRKRTLVNKRVIF